MNTTKKYIQKILSHNKDLKLEIMELENQIHKLKKKIIPPCRFCKIDSDFRCDSCQSILFEDFEVLESEVFEVTKS